MGFHAHTQHTHTYYTYYNVNDVLVHALHIAMAGNARTHEYSTKYNLHIENGSPAVAV